MGFLGPGTPSSVGSLPHGDTDVAAALSLALHPELPAAPQLPRRSPAEGMLAQVTAGMPGVRVLPDGCGLQVDRSCVATGDEDAGLDPNAWAGTLTFLRAAAAAGHCGPVKLQVTGAVTLGLALSAAGLLPSDAFSLAGAVVAGRVRALRREAARVLPESRLVIVLDEPGLTAYPASGFPLGAEETTDLLSGTLAAVGRNAVAGIHCCGATDWPMVLRAGPDLLSLPVEVVSEEGIGGLAMFLDRGGWVAWGAVPTTQPLGNCDEVYWRNLNSLWGDLARNGCDPMLLRLQSIITPACGLGLHLPSQVAGIYALVRKIAERTQDQALAARLSAGA